MGRKGILLVDDEPLATKYFATRFASQFPVFTASSAREALGILDEHGDRIGVIVTDERMPECSGVKLLETVRTRHPHTVRILTTAYMEMETLLEAINVGSVYSFVAKPWVLDNFAKVLGEALQAHDTQVRNAHIMERKLDDLRNQIIDSHVRDISIIAGRLSHYVCNALCPVTVLLEQLVQGKIANDYPHDFLVEVQSRVDEVVQTLKDLDRTASSGRSMKFEPVDLGAILTSVLQQSTVSRKERQLEVDVHIAPNIPKIQGLATEIEKLLRFMLAEEITSLPIGSHIHIRCIPRVVDSEFIGINLEFEDSVPLSPNLQPNSLLYPFNLRSGNPREFGIFLACCYLIARRHGGSLSAHAKPDKGVIYSFFLPSDPRETSDPTETLFSAHQI